MKKLKVIIFLILSAIGTLILSLGSFVLIGVIQVKLFLPQEYIMWIFKSPFSWLVFIYEGYIIFGFAYLFSKNLRGFILWVISLRESFVKRYKMSFLFTFVILNIVLMYTILYNVTVITDNKIVNYAFLSPQGKEYKYNDIVKIDTGVYGEKRYTHSKGEFYYIIQLKDGTKIDLTEMGVVKNDVDPRFVIEKLDSQYVNMGIPKVSSMDNFEYCTKHLDEIYTDKIRKILVNIK